MKELKEYRASLLAQLEESAKAFRTECLAVKDLYAPLEENGWNAHQLAVHTRDADQRVYGMRVRRTAAEADPEFSNFDGEAFMAQNYDATEPLQEILDSLVENVINLVAMLRALPDAAWSRTSRHTKLGRGITLQIWVEKDLSHIREHLASLRKAP
jgi:Mycothiol maleylpyruvate isomerase N-terminal domain